MSEGRCFVAQAAELRGQLPLPASKQWAEGTWDIAAFAHGGTTVLYFAPRDEDLQQPHEQDEFYFVVSGSATFLADGEPRAVGAGDMIFVPAYMPHRFMGMTEDFGTWAVFCGSGL